MEAGSQVGFYNLHVHTAHMLSYATFTSTIIKNITLLKKTLQRYCEYISMNVALGFWA